jgi:hypothetical protein
MYDDFVFLKKNCKYSSTCDLVESALQMMSLEDIGIEKEGIENVSKDDSKAKERPGIVSFTFFYSFLRFLMK